MSMARVPMTRVPTATAVVMAVVMAVATAVVMAVATAVVTAVVMAVATCRWRRQW